MQRSIQTIILLLISLMLPTALRAVGVGDVPNVHVADRTRYVSDPSGILSPETRRALDAQLGDLWRATSAEVVVVMVDKIDDDMTPEEFATELFEKWGIGKSDKDNGLLILVSRDDRAAQIRTGYGVEGIVPDVVAGRILRNEMFPRFREGDYDGGVTAAVGAIDALLRDPEAAAEVASKYANDARGDEEVFDGLFNIYLFVAGMLAAVML
ncbi:MAG: TPM domain-containing protein, partial [Duncaniella sp.]|nr:TPM domain-containing protein [Duncaniella sp.]